MEKFTEFIAKMIQWASDNWFIIIAFILSYIIFYSKYRKELTLKVLKDFLLVRVLKDSKEVIGIIFVAALIIFVKSKFGNLKNENYEEVFWERFVEILFAIITILISILLSYIEDFNKINLSDIKDKINNINSKKLKAIPSIYLTEEIDKIKTKLIQLLNNPSTHSILWELEPLKLDDLEKNGAFTGLDEKTIIEKIRFFRRKRITDIANALIIKGGQYWATETNNPSSLVSFDTSYWKEQEERLARFKPKEAIRFLIIKTSDLHSELTTNQNQFIEYIKANNKCYSNCNIKIPFTKNKKAQLYIIAYDNIINDVFCSFMVPNPLYDFAISQNGKSVTVFAQSSQTINQNAFGSISAFEYQYAKNSPYVKWYKHMLYQANNSPNTKHNNRDCKNNFYYVSRPIKSINDAIEFHNKINPSKKIN